MKSLPVSTAQSPFPELITVPKEEIKVIALNHSGPLLEREVGTVSANSKARRGEFPRSQRESQAGRDGCLRSEQPELTSAGVSRAYCIDLLIYGDTVWDQ